MATSGSLTTSGYQGRKLQFAWERTSYSSADNTSTIKWTLKGYGDATSSWYYAGNFKVKIAGDVEYSSSTRIKLYKGTEVASGTKVIKHNSNGTKSFAVSVEAGIFTNAVNCSGSKTFELTAIPRESTISATNAYVENESTITVNRKVSGYTHTITWACGTASGTVVTKGTNTSIKWKLPDSLYAQIGSTATEKTVTLTCTTYNGSSTIGSAKTCTLKAMTSAGRNGPTLSPTVTTYARTQELTGNTTSLINGISEADIVFNAAAQDGATLKSVKCINGTKSRTTDGTFSNCTSGEFVFTATDSRGYTTTVTKELTVKSYYNPTITFKAKMGVNGVATLTASGVGYVANFGAVSNATNFKVQYRYKVSGGSYTSWMDFSTVNKDYDKLKYSASQSVSGLDYTQTYYFQAQVVDLIQTVTSEEKKIRALPVWDWGANTFHLHGNTIIDNGIPYMSRDTSGGLINLIYLGTTDILNVGGGSNPPHRIQLVTSEGGDIAAKNGDAYYSLIGAAKAMSTTYELDCSVTAGSNYSDCSASAVLIGNNLRMTMSCTRNSAITTGNPSNETVMTIKVNHGGKIDVLYNVSFNNGATGGVATFQTTNTANSDGTTTITVTLTAAAHAGTQWNSYWSMPVNIALAKYLQEV